jgi:IS5 family transposase
MRKRKREFLDGMKRVVLWAALVQEVDLYYPEAKSVRPAFGIETMLRIHDLQQWFALSDPAMDEALHDRPAFREFAKLGDSAIRPPYETTILRFRQLLENHYLFARGMLEWRDRPYRSGLAHPLRTPCEPAGGSISRQQHRR